MAVHIVITNPKNGDSVFIPAGYVQAQGSIDGSCTVTASINDGGFIQSSNPTHYYDPQGIQMQWFASIPTGGLTAGDWATLTAAAKADDGSGVTSQTINVFLQGPPQPGQDGALLAKADGAKAAAGKKKG